MFHYTTNSEYIEDIKRKNILYSIYIKFFTLIIGNKELICLISIVNTKDYLNKSTNSLKNAVVNDLFSFIPRLDEIENL